MLAIITSKTTRREFATILRRLNKAMFKPTDISHLVGTIKLTMDPLKFQRAIRSEWDDPDRDRKSVVRSIVKARRKPS